MPAVEESQTQTEITPGATAEGNQGYAEALNAEGTQAQEGSVGTPEVTDKQETTPDANASQDPEFDLGEGLKAKQSEIKEWKQGYLRQQDYTKKTQEVSAVRKSFESSFGRLPQPEELNALGKVWKSYFENPQAKSILDAIITGGDLSKALSGQPSNQSSGNQSPEVQQLNQKIAALEQQLQGFTESQVKQQAAGVWSGWVDKQAKAGIQITQDIDSAMAPFVTALSQAHPDWDDNKILDTAYRHATIGEVEKKIVSQTLQQADKAKTQTPPKINPKVATKPDSQKSYSEIIADSL